MRIFCRGCWLLCAGAMLAPQLAKRARPFVLIGATDLTLGERFVFDQDQFDLLCADLGPLQVARAVSISCAAWPGT